MSDQPRYKLRQKAYLPQRPGEEAKILPADAEIVFLGQPGEHMEPLNEAAEAALKEHGGARSIRPELKLAMQGSGESGALMKQALGMDMSIDANVVAIVAQLMVRVSALEARLAPAETRVIAPPPPPPPRRAAV